MIYPIEGYEIVCDECGEHVVFHENSDHYTIFEIEDYVEQKMSQLKADGWQIDDEAVKCPQCSSKS